MKTARARFIVATALAGLALSTVGATATVAPGTAGKDVTRGQDSDVASNPFIQPPGVVAKQHMEATDVLIGRGNDDLLQGNRGSDTLVGGGGDDILIGGPERFTSPNSDVLLGDAGDDINIWSPGDGSDAFIGDRGRDTMVFSPFLTRPNGSIRHVRAGGRLVPRVDLGGQPGLTCALVKVPPSQRLGEQFLVRFLVDGVMAVTVRQKDVERVLCPSPREGRARVADLTARHPAFRTVRLASFQGTLGTMVARP
ncbi:hypothetical protein [Nocardioides sp. cx-173]|uniref:hypothetical protein n=1 Tax=Nocardioides sp. cx-173 TaxID=2898796 RepID=UPI001E2F45AB|nr:hypothetical protein [Nocardioides sp. cx-173]MCD4526023.1 hypothetical protein [Nocardioides sp. cx-173]UGB43718.1 hypothetical protein LQ940_09380 [Nocardioides sp. cx-173]